MPSALRRFTKHFFIITNLVVALLFVLACITPYVNPQRFWLFGVLTLGFPVLFLLLAVFLFFWLFIKKTRRSLISLVVLLLGWKTARETFGLNLSANKENEQGAIKVMSWNVHMFDYYDNKKEPEIKENMFALIRKEQPAIACFQEYAYTLPARDSNYTIAEQTKKLGMPYHFIQSHPLDSVHLRQIKLHFGKAIFSKYPIVNQQHIFKHAGTYNYSFMYADIALPTDTVRVFNIHLQSLYFGNKEYDFVENPVDNDESIEDGSKNVLRKIKRGFYKRMEQADTVAKYIRQSPYPVIVCGDFNDVPGSYAYRTVKNDLQDAFVKKGWGIGRTFTRLSPTLRIDNIFADERFSVESYRRISRELSDHYPIITLLKIKHNQ
ncbi:MAG: endonuclease/exonuclease/phosphatase family protein [Sphingobacteriales bacterium]|nr:endonuclease/exonuclease/phosphatase family protein [Sphingobacteriales bacterium]